MQDYNEKVQRAIHRMQPLKHVQRVTEWAREIGYDSISHDLVFGLPFQNLDDVLNTIEQTQRLMPDVWHFTVMRMCHGLKAMSVVLKMKMYLKMN